MKYIATTLYVAVIVLLLGVSGLFVVSLLPINGMIQIKIVQSGSMEPTILTGSLVIIKPESSYDVGDIVTYGEDSKSQIPTTHRIVAIDTESPTGPRLVTKGDANEEADAGFTDVRKVIGRVLVSIPYLGYVLDFAKKPLGFTLMIGIPAAAIVVDELLKIVAEVRRARKRPETHT